MRQLGIHTLVFILTAVLGERVLFAQEVSAGSGEVIEITSCVVYSVKHADKAYDCMTEAKKALESCAQKQVCEIPIGFNLTAGKDLDVGSGFLGKQVKITYTCGEIRLQSGPYNQDDHASVVLDCSGMWW